MCRSLAASDNRQAAARRNSIAVRVSHWFPEPICTTDTDGETICKIDSSSDIPRFRFTGDHVNPGPIVIHLYDNQRHGKSVFRTTATAAAGVPGAHFDIKIPLIQCRGTASDSYFRVEDTVSGRRSDRIRSYVLNGRTYQVSTVCAVL